MARRSARRLGGLLSPTSLRTSLAIATLDDGDILAATGAMCR